MPKYSLVFYYWYLTLCLSKIQRRAPNGLNPSQPCHFLPYILWPVPYPSLTLWYINVYYLYPSHARLSIWGVSVYSWIWQGRTNLQGEKLHYSLSSIKGLLYAKEWALQPTHHYLALLDITIMCTINIYFKRLGWDNVPTPAGLT